MKEESKTSKKSSLKEQLMKTQDKNPDEDIIVFFREMKAQNNERPVPDFIEMPKKNLLMKLLPLGIAASLLFFLWLFPDHKSDVSLETDQVIITLDVNQNNEQQFNIEFTHSLETWEAPTSSLLTEF
jgi:hypothetical protein